MLHGKRRCAAVPSCNFPWRQVRCTHGVRHLWEIHKQMPRDNQRWVGHWYQLEAWNLSEWRLSGTHKRASCGLEPSWQGLSVQHMLQTHRQWFVDWTSRAAARHPTSALQRRSSAELNSFVWNDKDRNQRQHDDRHLWSRKQIEGWWIGRPLFCVLILRERGFLDYDLRVRVAWILRCKASLEFEVTFSGWKQEQDNGFAHLFCSSPGLQQLNYKASSPQTRRWRSSTTDYSYILYRNSDR